VDTGVGSLLEPRPSVHRGRAIADLARQPHDVPEDQLGDAARVREGRVEHRNPLGLSVREGDLVRADAEASDGEEAIARVDDLLRHLRLAADAEDVQVLDLGDELVLRQRCLQRLDLKAIILQHLDTLLRHALQEQDLDLVLREGRAGLLLRHAGALR